MPRIPNIACALFLAGWNLVFPASAWTRQESASAAQNSQSPFATSLPFDLEPQVERASIDLRRPQMRSLYDAIARAYGIRLLYDRDLGELPVTGDFRLQDVTLEEALEAAGSISKTFVAPLDPHTAIVAADTAEKRSEYERQVLGSFHMDDQTTPQELTEISNALRNMVDLRRVTQDARSNWITVLGRTRQVAVAGQFVRTLQKASGEVLLEVNVWEIDSTRARELGVLPPQLFQLIYLGKSPGTTKTSVLTWGQGRTLYGVNLLGLTAILNSSSSLVRSHQVIYLRASDGQKARFTAGQRFPVVTDLVSSSLRSGASSTQQASASGFYPAIQYEDIGVVVEATPHLHAGRELTVQLDLALRSLGPRAENGLPTFANQEVTEQVRLKDGEGYLLGGILSRADQRSRTGYPWLSRLPLVGALFGRATRQQTESELILLIRPRMMRLGPAEEFASRSIFFGKELTGLPAPVEPAPAAPPPVQPPPVQPPVPGATPPQPGVPAPLGVPFPGGFPPGVIPQPVPTQVTPQPTSRPGAPPPDVPPEGP